MKRILAFLFSNRLFVSFLSGCTHHIRGAQWSRGHCLVLVVIFGLFVVPLSSYGRTLHQYESIDKDSTTTRAERSSMDVGPFALRFGLGFLGLETILSSNIKNALDRFSANGWDKATPINANIGYLGAGISFGTQQNPEWVVGMNWSVQSDAVAEKKLSRFNEEDTKAEYYMLTNNIALTAAYYFSGLYRRSWYVGGSLSYLGGSTTTKFASGNETSLFFPEQSDPIRGWGVQVRSGIHLASEDSKFTWNIGVYASMNVIQGYSGLPSATNQLTPAGTVVSIGPYVELLWLNK